MTFDNMLQELEDWRISVYIHKVYDSYHCEMYRLSVKDFGQGYRMPTTSWYGVGLGTTRFNAIQDALRQFHGIVKEMREEGFKDADI